LGFFNFAELQKNTTIFVKRVTALFLIALFIFIHAVQIHHHHDNILSIDAANSGQDIVKSIGCDICKYHFVKEGALPIVYQQIEILRSLDKPLIALSISPVTSIGLSSSGRGPPSVA